MDDAALRDYYQKTYAKTQYRVRHIAYTYPLRGLPPAEAGRLKVIAREKAARTARRGACQNQPQHALRMPHHEVLGDHPAEGHPDDVALVPADGIEQRGGVIGVVRHRVGHVGLARLTEPALVVHEHLEALLEGTLPAHRVVAEIASRAADRKHTAGRRRRRPG